MQMAEDIAQDVFMKAWEKRATIRRETVKSLLYTIAGNLSINQLKHRQIVFEHSNALRTSSDYETPQFQMESEEFNRKLQQSLSALPENSRVVFLMNRIEKMTYAEIAERLGISVKAVEKRMHKALTELRKRIDMKI